MWTFLFALLFAITLLALIAVLFLFTQKIAEVEKERSELEVEETRVFDFLHGLGEAFSEGIRPRDLHRLIVEGAVRILEAHGGALYLPDKTDSVLVPAFVTNGCPALVPLPADLISQISKSPNALDSFLKLHSVRREEGVIGRVWSEGQTVVLSSVDLDFLDNRPSSLAVHSAIIGPLSYRRKTMGVLAVANGQSSKPFTRDEIQLFKTIAEQSAFALYNEAVYLEAEEKRRLDSDLRTAREIQRILLPSKPPAFEGFCIDGVNLPARQVSGDYFDFIPMPGDRLGIPIADVSGKGIPASLIMAMCRGVIRSQAPQCTSPADLLRRVNRLIYPDIREDMFISMAFVILQKGSSDILFARAGHDPPLLFRAATSELKTLAPKGMALGIDSGNVFDRVCEDATFRMEPGDTLVLYTDGATEVLDDAGNEFGLSRVEASIRLHAAAGAGEIVRATMAEIAKFIGGHHQYDDITLIAVQKT